MGISFLNSLGSQNTAEQATQTQAIEKITETELNDDPRATVADKESQKVCNKWADKPKDHLNEFDDCGAIFGKGKRYLEPFTPATVRAKDYSHKATNKTK